MRRRADRPSTTQSAATADWVDLFAVCERVLRRQAASPVDDAAAQRGSSIGMSPATIRHCERLHAAPTWCASGSQSSLLERPTARQSPRANQTMTAAPICSTWASTVSGMRPMLRVRLRARRSMRHGPGACSHSTFTMASSSHNASRQAPFCNTLRRAAPRPIAPPDMPDGGAPGARWQEEDRGRTCRVSAEATG